MSSPPVPEQSPREKSKFAKRIASRFGLGKSKRSKEGISSPRETSEDVDEYQTSAGSPTSSSATRGPETGPLYVSSEAARSKTNYSPMQQSIQHNDSLRKSQGAFAVPSDTASVDPWATPEVVSPPPRRSTGSSASRISAIAPGSENASGLDSTTLSDTATSGLQPSAKPTEPSSLAPSSMSYPEGAPLSNSSANSAFPAAGSTGGSGSSAQDVGTFNKPTEAFGTASGGRHGQTSSKSEQEQGGLKEPRPSSQLPDASQPLPSSNLGPAVAAGLQGLPSHPSGESGGSTGSTLGPDLGPKHTHDIGPKHTHDGPLSTAASDSAGTQDTSPVAVPPVSSEPSPPKTSTFDQTRDRSDQQNRTAPQSSGAGSASSAGPGGSSQGQGSAGDIKEALAPIAGSTASSSEQPSLTQDPVGYTQSVAASAGQKLKDLQAQYAPSTTGTSEQPGLSWIPRGGSQSTAASAGQKLKELQGQYAPAPLGGKVQEGGGDLARPAGNSPAADDASYGTTATSQQPSLTQNPIGYARDTTASAGQKLQDLQTQYAPAALGGKAQDGSTGVKGSTGSTSLESPAGDSAAPSGTRATSQQPSLTQNVVGYTQNAAASAGQTLKSLQDQYAPAALGGKAQDGVKGSADSISASAPAGGYAAPSDTAAASEQPSLTQNVAGYTQSAAAGAGQKLKDLQQQYAPSTTAKSGDSALTQDPAGYSQGVAASAGQKLRELQGQYAPVALGGKIEEKDDVKGLEPARGQPEDAPAKDAAVGGPAASIAGLAAAAASGDKSALTAKGDTDDIKGYKPAQGVPEHAPAEQAAVGGAAASIAPLAAAAAAGDTKALAAKEDTLAANPTAESLDYATSKAGGALGGDAEDVTGLKPQQGLPKDAPSTEAAVGGAAGSIAPLAAAAASGDARSADQERYAGFNPDASSAAAYASGKGGDGIANGSDSVSQEASVQGLQPRQGLPRDAPSSQAATGGTAASIAPIAAAVASGHSEESAQGAAKPAVNEPMAYSKLKAVTAGTASDPANGTAQTAPSEGSAQRSQEAGLSSGRIGASGEGFPAAAGDRDLLDGTGGLEKRGVGGSSAAGPSSAAYGKDDDEDDAEPEIREMPSMDPDAYPANFVDNRPPPTDLQRLGRQASRMKTAEQRRRLGLDRQDPARHAGSEVNVIAFTFGALVVLSGFKVPLPTWAWAIALGLALLYTINRSKRNRARA